jgi:hypothetical protein
MCHIQNTLWCCFSGSPGEQHRGNSISTATSVEGGKCVKRLYSNAPEIGMVCQKQQKVWKGRGNAMRKQFLCISVLRTQLARQFYSSFLICRCLACHQINYNSYANEHFAGSEDMPIKIKMLLMVVMVWMLYHCPVSVISILWLEVQCWGISFFIIHPALTLFCSSSQSHPRPWYTMTLTFLDLYSALDSNFPCARAFFLSECLWQSIVNGLWKHDGCWSVSRVEGQLFPFVQLLYFRLLVYLVN